MRFLIAAFCVLLVIGACRRKKSEDLEPFAKVTLNANPEANPMMDSVNYEFYIFDSEQGFKEASVAEVPSKYVYSGIVKGGKIEIPRLPAGTDYYVFVRYFDSKSYPNFNILYSNEESNFVISAQEKQAEMTANVKLKPQEGLFTFFSKDDNIVLSPIKVTVGNATDSEIISSGNIEVAKPQTIKLRKGSYSVKGKNTFCEWMKTAQVEPGKNTLVECEVCEYGRVSFLGSKAGIKVYLGAGMDNLIGVVKNPASESTCTDPNAVNTVLAPGKYSYYAFDPLTKCAWSDTFSIKRNDCHLIPLNCN